MKMFKILFVLITLEMFCSCSTSKITNDEISKINGVYNANTIDDNYFQYNFISLLNRKFIKDTLQQKPINDYKFELENLGNNHIQITVINEKNKILNRKNYKYKKKAKSIILKNKNVKPLAIPYLFGALDITKLALKPDENRNLFIEIYKHHSGGIFLIPMSWSSKKLVEKYQRIK